MIKPKMIYGDDNGFCSLWDIDLQEYEDYRDRIDTLYGDGKEDEAEALETELDGHRIPFDEFQYENGYVPGYVGYLAQVFGIDTDSN